MPTVAPFQVGPQVWRGADLAAQDDWLWRLDQAEIDELLSASAPYSDASEADLSNITSQSFGLASMAQKLGALRTRLTHGRGFELLRGFPINEVSQRQAEAAFVGLGAHLGLARSQNAAGDLLGHVRNVGADVTDPTVRIYQTDKRQTFHTDSADVVGLMCLETAASGGDSLLASVGAVYNEMRTRDERLAALLFEPIATDRRGEVPSGAEPYFSIPVLTWFDETLTVIYQRQYIDSAQRFDEVEPLAQSTVAALDLFDQIMNEPDIHLAMTLQTGDMQFVHNHSLLHDRTGFIDKPASPRHLLRLWLSVPGDRELPAVFTQRYGTIEVGNRGGIIAR